MSGSEPIAEEFAVLLAAEEATRWDFESLRGKTTCSTDVLYDQIALFAARGFLDGTHDFWFGDAVMNTLIGFTDFKIPVFAWVVYLAFDEGEYYHPGDSREIRLEEKYTRPMLLDALATVQISRSDPA
jgi:hypothetical protein